MISGDRSLALGKQGAFFSTLQGFSSHWERIDIITPRAAWTPAGRALLAQFPNVAVHSSPYALWLQPWWILQQGRRLHAVHRYQVMTVHEYPPFYNGLGAWRLHRSIGIPYALEIHHVVGFPSPANWQERIARVLSRLYLPWATRQAASVRVVSRSVQSTLKALGASTASVAIVPSFYLDTSVFVPHATEPVIDCVCCARLVANKGLQQLIAAMVQVPGANLTIIGDGPLRTALEALIQRLELKDRVRLLGWLPGPADVARVLQQSRVFVMPSASEGGPRAALEAMACGLPVVATRVGLMPEVIVDGQSGGLFTTGDPVDLARQIRTLLADPSLRQRLGTTACETVQKFARAPAIKAYADYLQSFV